VPHQLLSIPTPMSADAASKFVIDTYSGDLKTLEKNHSADAKFEFPGMTLGHSEITAIWTAMYDSFPNLKFNPSFVRAEGNDVIIKLEPKGTHTGKPFGLPNLPPIAATNVACANGPEYCRFSVANGKITNFKIIDPLPPIEKNGPIGFYMQIGGKVPKAK